ncbi:hypothetical protein KQ939_07135 [Planococcus sp. CP5-4]|uniref:hypothetical protein n=1 Tax=unclassified Planococcus (in: firmicutes) TaxID=2662419 RepID=UPI001C211CB1|nr:MULTISPECIES: hypothetical protein [unclassified Planococcus (in: firmicutes)]MBU9672955.1 hypothetical protein [Planococcus sp. CP5-4_YE]MBV0908727.1 hypothetical protein [Planococcus sp. CP5-4_UN]MBW6063496.1 hypothetical protein [Planococcus sp. CP5-4]
MKQDFRMTYSLWNMAFILILAVMAVGFTSSFVNVTKTDSSLSIEAQAFEGFVLFAALMAYLVLITIYLIALGSYNRKNPDKKISAFSIRPPEYMEQDEGMTFITRKAVQKVYTFITWSLPFFAVVVMLAPVPKLLIIWGILAIAFGQNLIYYLEMRRHLKEAAE